MNDFITNRLLNISQGVQTEKITIDNSSPSASADLYAEIFERAQAYIVNDKLDTLTVALTSGDFSGLQPLVEDFVRRNYPVVTRTHEEFDDIISRLLADMTGYGFLNKYFAIKDKIEEININGWNSIEIRYCDGRRELAPERFHNAQQAKDVIQRILQQNNKHMDETRVYEISYIGKAVRIATTITPVADKEIGVVASIRFIHSAVFTLDQLIKNKMFTQEAGEALRAFINHGVSICFCGSTGSGKTTVCNALLESVAPMTRVITLEAGTREFDLIKYDDAGRVINNRVHLQTRPHKDENLNVDLQTLLDLILKFDPDIVAVGEMVSEEAFIASETARTGHTVVTTIHTNNAYDAYYRMFTLGIRKYSLKENVMLKFMVDAFPIVVYTKKYNDGVRRVQTILEAEYIGEQIQYNELYRYNVTDNIVRPDGKIIVRGDFEKVNPPTQHLKQLLIDNGLSKEVADSL